MLINVKDQLLDRMLIDVLIRRSSNYWSYRRENQVKYFNKYFSPVLEKKLVPVTCL